MTSLHLPASYKSLVGSRTGASFRQVAVVQERSMEDLRRAMGPSDVLIKVRYAGINGGCETFRARGEHAFSGNQGLENFPLGAEGVGIIQSIGGRVRGLKEGDAVAFVGGAYSEYVTARGILCAKVPEASAEFAALTISGTTAVSALEAVGRIRPSDVVLVTAAAGGTGHFAVQLAKNVHKCHVIATCGGEAKAAYLRSLGVDLVIDHTKEDPAEVLAREYKGRLTLVFEGVGGRMRQAAVENLSPEGRLLGVGYISEYPHNDTSAEGQRGAEGGGASGGEEMPSTAEMFWSGLNVTRGDQVIYGNVWPEDRGAVPKLRQRAFDLYRDGLWKPLIDPEVFRGLNRVPDAIDYMLSGRSRGKVVAEI